MQFFSKVFSAETRSSYSLNTTCFRVDVSPLNKASYKSTVDVAELGDLTLGLVYNRSSLVVRKQDESDSHNNKRFTLMYIVDGEITISNKHGTIPLKKGQLILIDNSCSRRMFVYKSVTLLLICVSHYVLQRYLPDPDNLLTLILDNPKNINELPLFLPLLSLWEHLKTGELEEFSTSIGEELMQDISYAYAQHGSWQQRSRHALRMMALIKKHIESNLYDPELNAEKISKEFNISSRYLRSLFQGGEKLPHYIQRRRIEESARMLASPQHRSSSITEIALFCGFNNATHFSRCFRLFFNETAREFRRRHLQMEQDAIQFD